jgi:hypothetical protein
MNAQVAALRTGGAVFGLMSVAQMTRELACPQLDVVVGRLPMPLWPSVLAAVFLAGMCIWMWKVSYHAGQ